jgi:hypothetical protein
VKYPLGNKGLLLSVPEMVKFSELLGRSTSKRIKCIVMTFHTIKDQTEGVCVPSCMTSVGETLAEKQRPAFICARDDNEIFEKTKCRHSKTIKGIAMKFYTARS